MNGLTGLLSGPGSTQSRSKLPFVSIQKIRVKIGGRGVSNLTQNVTGGEGGV